MTLKKAIVEVGKLYAQALTDKMIRKPLSYALYQTWQMADRTESERKFKVTNFDRIKDMSAWELAEFIFSVSNNSIKITNCQNECERCEFSEVYCISGIGEWLNSEAQNDRD